MRLAPLPLLALLLLAACGRPLTPNEVAFLATIQGDALDTSRIRLHDGGQMAAPKDVPPPPRVTCQSRLYPPAAGPTIRVRTGAATLFQDVLVREDIFSPDLLAGWPEVLPLADAMLLAHEMVHAWQWQHRDLTHYHPLKAAFEHVRTADPYLFDVDTDAGYLDYSFEQQGAIMEEYVCCRTLAPEAARTERLHAMLGRYFPLRPLDEPETRLVALPWDGVEVEGICD